MQAKKKDRREQILSVTARLIEEKGLAHTSTNDIVQTLGIARGTLYHYYHSKEDILNDLVNQVSQDLFDQARSIANQLDLPVLARLWGVIASLNAEDLAGNELMNHIHQEENLLLHHKIQTQILKQLPQILLPVIQEGVEQELFATDYPYEALEMMVVYVTQVIDSDSLALDDLAKARRLQVLLKHMELLLGADPGLLVNSYTMLGAHSANQD
ncbi:TetR/AcrR family transcriptional regulator [Hutsoniella sourekii]